MNNPNTSTFPGMSAMTDTLEFMKNMWGGMSTPGVGIPGIIMPTLSVEEIEKQIKDLKAVESWLNVNMTMLRSTIQALEVQSATISTLQAMGQSFSDAVKPGTQSPEPDNTKSRRGGFSFSEPAPEGAPKASHVPEPSPESVEKAASRDDGKPAQDTDARKSSTDAKPEDANFAAPMANPAAWWNMLQDQFKQAVGTAMETEPPAPAAKKAKTAAKAVAKPKPAAKTAKPAPASKSKAAAKTVPKAKSKSKASSRG